MIMISLAKSLTYLLMIISIRRLTSAWNSNFSALAASFSLSAGVKDEAAASGEGITVGAALSEEESSADTNEASLTGINEKRVRERDGEKNKSKCG
jgi:hypothetical protein